MLCQIYYYPYEDERAMIHSLTEEPGFFGIEDLKAFDHSFPGDFLGENHLVVWSPWLSES